MLEGELQTELNDSWVVSVHRMEEGTSSQAIHPATSSSRITGCSTAVAADNVVAGIPGMRLVVDPELRVVENVERFGAEFEFALAEKFEMLQQGDIEICTSGIFE